MNILITGSTGFIGTELTLTLADNGHKVYAVYRDDKKISRINHKNVIPVKANILDENEMQEVIKKCEQIFHIAAFTEVWAKDKQIIYDINVKASEIIFKLALKHNIKRVVFTSSAGVFGPSADGQQVNEQTKRATDYFLEYERTKAIAVQKLQEYTHKGLDAVIVSPTRVYGPGLLNKSNGSALMIKSYTEGKWRIIPGNGKSIGNYVFIENVVEGLILAMQKGKKGEQYILGGDNISYIQFFETVSNIFGKKYRMFKLPLFIMLAVANVMMVLNFTFKIKPLITPALVRKFNYNWNVSSAKAEKELGYKPIKFAEGAKRTIEWIKSLSHSKNV